MIPSMAQPTRPERLLPDSFWLYSYKVVMCPLRHSHDWEKCIYAHDGEKARRRHPSKYQAVQCPEARAKKTCPRGEECPCTHHLFEYWLHPDRYMTCLCELGASCNRPICFFAHHPAELRPLPEGLSHAANSTGSSRRRAAAAAAAAATAAAAGMAHTPASSSTMSEPARSRSPSVCGASSADVLSSVRPQSTGSPPGAGVLLGAGSTVMRSLSGASGSDMLQSQSQSQPLPSSGPSSTGDVRPGFGALDALSASCAAQAAAAEDAAALSTGTLAAAAALKADMIRTQQQQQAGRATYASSTVLILEAPAQLAPKQDLPLAEVAQQFGKLNLTAAGTGWLSPTAALGQSNSCMSLASSNSSLMGITGLGSDPQLIPGASGTNTAFLMDAQTQQTLRAQSISPGSSPCDGGSSTAAFMPFAGPAASAGSSGGALQMPPGSFALLGPDMNAQLAAMQAAMDDPLEQLSFSLWDLGGPCANPATAQQLASLVSNTATGRTSMGGFGGFAGSSRAGGPPPPSSEAPQVVQLAAAAADRLLLAQQAQRASSPGAAGLGLRPPQLSASAAAISSRADTAKEARLTLLRAWLNAAAAAADGGAGAADGSLQDELVLRASACFSASPGQVAPLTTSAVGAATRDLVSVLSHKDAVLLLQQLQLVLQQQVQQHPSNMFN